MPLGQITLPVTFGTPSNYHAEFIKFEVADFKSSYHAILGRLDLPSSWRYHTTHIALSLIGDLKRAFDCNVQVVQIAAKAQAASEREEIATIAAEIKSEDLEILAKKPSILTPPKEADVNQIDLCTGDPSKTATISAHLLAK
jgi:hypothetical protein